MTILSASSGKRVTPDEVATLGLQNIRAFTATLDTDRVRSSPKAKCRRHRKAWPQHRRPAIRYVVGARPVAGDHAGGDCAIREVFDR
jgi:hypothetical protein